MLSTDRPDQAGSGGEMASTALVPLTPTLQWAPKAILPHPDPSFVTQLIANAEHVPQASRMRRASPADARLAYGDARLAYGHKRPLPSVAARTRQVA